MYQSHFNFQFNSKFDAKMPPSTVTIYRENFTNFPSEKAEFLMIFSLFSINGIKFKVERLNNVEFISIDGNLPSFSIDSKLFSGIESALTFIEDHLNKINSKGDQKVANKSMEDRIRIHSEIILFNYGKSIFWQIFMFEEWFDDLGYKTVAEEYGKRHCWPLSRFLTAKKRKSIMKVLNNGSIICNRQNFLVEFDTFCKHLSVNLTEFYLFDNIEPSKVDIIIYSYFEVIKLYPDMFRLYIDIMEKYPQINELLSRINGTYENLVNICIDNSLDH